MRGHWGSRLAQRIVQWVPVFISQAPERALVNLACVLIGLSTYIDAPPRSLQSIWPPTMRLGWSLLMVLGGVAVLTGQWLLSRRGKESRLDGLSLARSGYLAILIAATVYGVGLLTVFGVSRITSAAIFLAIAAAKALRLLVSTAARGRLRDENEAR